MSNIITSFADAHRRLESRSAATKRHMYGLDHMFELMDFLGNPQKQLRVIHVAGTSGKTSTAYYVAALLKAAGFKVGLTVSPHIDEINERVQIDLKPLPEAEFCRRFSRFLDATKDCRVIPNYFELFMSFALWEFAAQRVDFAVVETGIGGLLDSTNIFEDADKICVITDIGFDHTSLLGGTLPEITEHKAGIIQLHNAVFCNQQGEEVMSVIRAQAQAKQADLHIFRAPNLSPDFNFLPLFQRRNFGLALQVAKFIAARDGHPLPDKAAVLQAAQTYIPARMETTKKDGHIVILDIAHNPQKLRNLIKSVSEKYPGQSVAALLRLPTAEHRIEQTTDCLKEVAPAASHIILTSLNSSGEVSKSFHADLLTQACQDARVGSFEIIPNPRQAFAILRTRPEAVLLVTGSTFLLNHIRD